MRTPLAICRTSKVSACTQPSWLFTVISFRAASTKVMMSCDCSCRSISWESSSPSSSGGLAYQTVFSRESHTARLAVRRSTPSRRKPEAATWVKSSESGTTGEPGGVPPSAGAGSAAPDTPAPSRTATAARKAPIFFMRHPIPFGCVIGRSVPARCWSRSRESAGRC